MGSLNWPGLGSLGNTGGAVEANPKLAFGQGGSGIGDSSGAGWGTENHSGAPSYGPGTMSESQRASLSPAGLLGLEGLPGSMLNQAVNIGLSSVPGVNMANTMLGLALNLDEALAAWGVPTASPNPFAGYMSPSELQGLKDYAGVFASEEAQAKNMGIMGNLDSPFGLTPALGYTGASGWSDLMGANTPGGWMGASVAPNSAIAANAYGGLGPGGSVDTGGPGGFGMGGAGSAEGSMGDGGSIGGGGYDSGGGADKAEGGVTYAAHGPMHITMGEAGPETGIFVPLGMERPGIQGKEKSVRRGLKAALNRLESGRGK